MVTKLVEIASLLRTAIDSGALRAGEKLNSIRQLASLHSVSPPTIVSALRLLEREGYIESRPRSGFFVCHPQNTLRTLAETAQQPQDVGITATVRRLFEGKSEGMVPLGAALPNPKWLPINELKSVVAAAHRALGTETQQYSLPPGRFDARNQIAQFSAKRGTNFGPEELIISQGATEAISLALNATCKQGDIVLVETPAYFGHLCLLEKLGLKALEAPTHPVTGLEITAVENLIKKYKISAILCTPTIQNPLGATMPIVHKRKLAAISAHHDIPVIEDDVYGLLSDGGESVPPLKAFDQHGTVLYCSSVSKCLSPGWRIGWISAGKYHSKVLDDRFCSQLSGSPFIEAALARYLADPAFMRHIARLNRRSNISRKAFTLAISQYFPKGTEISQAKGGYLLWVKLPNNVDSRKLAELAKASNIIISPGPLFSPSGGLKNYLRINAGHDFDEMHRESIKLIGELASRV